MEQGPGILACGDGAELGVLVDSGDRGVVLGFVELSLEFQ
jgi:hypothetical protein